MAYKLDLSPLKGVKPVLERIRVEDLEIDPSIQRPLDPNKVRKIYNDFAEAGVGVVAVSARKNGAMIVLDGQHRRSVLLLKLAEGGPEEVDANVYRDLTKEQEALLFLTLNNTTKPRATDKYRVAVQAGDEVATAIDGVLNTYGMKVSTFPSDGNVSAVETLRRIYVRSEKRGWEPNLLQQAVITITRAWGQKEWALKGLMFEALAAMYDVYADKLVMSEFITNLAEENPKDLILEALHFARARSRKPSMALAEILGDVWNKHHRGSRRLPEWRHRQWK